jgi:uncharacterized repeat protein (TIGR03847 family)
MEPIMWDFGRAELLEPEAIGEPGKRTFRVRVRSGADTASLWLEKEQLAALTLAIRQLLEQTDDTDTSERGDSAPAGSFPDPAQVEFKIGRLGIGYDESDRMVSIFAYTIEDAGVDEDDDSATPSFSCNASRTQCRAFAERAEEVISGGRPVCVLCGGPIEDGEHRCGRRNGHSKVRITLDDE